MKEEDRQKVETYIRENGVATEEEIVAGTGLDMVTVLNVLHTLKKQGVLDCKELPPASTPD